MRVFISWAGEETREFARSFADWVALVLQEVEPFVSCGDIEPGERWSSKIDEWLEQTDFGILCVTRSNAMRPWLNYEAGALSKKVSAKARVVPYLLDGKPSDFEEPLSLFNMCEANPEATRALIVSLNKLLLRPLKDTALDAQFNAHWSRLDAAIKQATTLVRTAGKTVKERDSDSILDEILEKVRAIYMRRENVPLIPGEIEVGTVPRRFSGTHYPPHADQLIEGIVVNALKKGEFNALDAKVRLAQSGIEGDPIGTILIERAHRLFSAGMDRSSAKVADDLDSIEPFVDK